MQEGLSSIQCMVDTLIMHEVNLRGVDLNLLTVLAALLRDSNVTRAATALGMSQPAVSRALGRLRALLGDPLLVRGPAGMQPTPRAQALAPRVQALLAAAAGLIADRPFDPAQLSTAMTVAMTDHQTLFLLPRLLALLRAQAPGLSLRVQPYGADTLEALQRGRLDLAFSVAGQALPPSLRQAALYRDRFATVLRQGHPAIADWSLARYCALDHVLVSFTGQGQGAMDMALADIGQRRRVALWVPHFTAALHLVAGSELTVTLPRSLAETYGPDLGLVVLDPPLPSPAFTIVLLWPEVLDAAPAHRWLRAQVRQAARGLVGVETA